VEEECRREEVRVDIYLEFMEDGQKDKEAIGGAFRSVVGGCGGMGKCRCGNEGGLGSLLIPSHTLELRSSRIYAVSYACGSRLR
jgi:hypothetical protein